MDKLEYLNKIMDRISQSMNFRKRFQTKSDLNEMSETKFDLNEMSEVASQIAKLIRGNNRAPSIIIHGVMPRSGTVFTGELLSLHPAIHAYPNKIWEIPFLQLTDNLLKFQEQFFQAYDYNRGKIGENDLLTLFGSSFIAYLYSFVPSEKRMLLKVPSVRYLNYFPLIFPYENLLLLMRDGRDIVSSTIKTWPNSKFSRLCEIWDYSAKIILNFQEYYIKSYNKYLILS